MAPNFAAAKTHSYEASRKVAGVPGQAAKSYKLDDEVTRRSNEPTGSNITRVIVTLVPGAKLPAEFKRYMHYGNRKDNDGNNDDGRLDLINGQVLDLPNGVLKKFAAHPSVFRVHHDRDIATHNYRTSITTGARTVRDQFGYTGAGITIAVIDSGIATFHDDLTNKTSTLYPYGNQRVSKFVDFVNGRALPYDDNGHGSHVAGIIAGNGADSDGEKSGIAPGASLISLKVLDADGKGTISNIIAALGWVAANAQTYNIRVVNMSVGASIHESYWTDPLTLAAKAVTDKGITVVTAAGNLGKNAAGHLQYGGIMAPANAPWVLTVGASSSNGTVTRNDDSMASFSSAGPTYIDFEAKPDVVAPGVGTVSIAVPGSTFYINKAQYLLDGKPVRGAKSYLSLSGTSMAAPVVAGTVALMLEANPNLTPNLIKALLQYTAQQYADPLSTTVPAKAYSPMRQGAGFLNALGAVRLAKFYKNPQTGERMPVQKVWSRTINWGSHRIQGGIIKPDANAWAANIVWGTAKTMGALGDNIVWGTSTNLLGNIVWGTALLGDNIVWGTDCGGADCDNVVWGTAALGDNIVWGTAELGDNIVWGTAAGDNIVWGTAADAEPPVTYSDEVVEPLPNPAVEFGDVVPLVPVTPVTVTPVTVPFGA